MDVWLSRFVPYLVLKTITHLLHIAGFSSWSAWRGSQFGVDPSSCC